MTSSSPTRAPERSSAENLFFVETGAAHQRAKLLVFGIGKAQGVAVRQQPCLAGEVQDGRVVEQCHAAGRCICRAQKKVTIATHEKNIAQCRGLAQCASAPGFEPGRVVRGGVIADPDLEQVTQDAQVTFGGLDDLSEGLDQILAQLPRRQWGRTGGALGSDVRIAGNG